MAHARGARLKRRVAVVCGGARGIGRASALALAREGNAVAIADLREDQAAAVASELTDAGAKAVAVAMDVTDPAAVRVGMAHASDARGDRPQASGSRRRRPNRDGVVQGHDF